MYDISIFCRFIVLLPSGRSFILAVLGCMNISKQRGICMSWRKFQNEELHQLHYLQNVIEMRERKIRRKNAA
jgi:hypothetical protein